MECLNAQLRQLQQRVARKSHLQIRADALRIQRSALLDKAAKLDAIVMKEEADVARLEGRSLAAFFYNVVGKMDEKLDQERREAYGARVKYDAAVRELQAVEQDLDECSRELASLSLCEDHYRMCLEEKAPAIKATGSSDGLEILRLETCLQTLEFRLRELNEAADAGKSARFTAKMIQAVLDSAENIGTRDLFGAADLTMDDLLDDTQSLTEQLQVRLRRFRTELAEVGIDADMLPGVEDFGFFADNFFDGLFADWVLLDRIGQAREQVKRVIGRIDAILSRLEEQVRGIRAERSRIRIALDEHITTA